MPYCELLCEECFRVPPRDISRCDDCSESEMFIAEEITKMGLTPQDVKIIRSPILEQIRVRDIASEKMVMGIKAGRLISGK